MDTLLLDLTNWDLCIDASGNIAVASAPYAIAQDVASAQRTFQSEVYYDNTLGVPYFENVLGHSPPTSLLAEYEVLAALTVPGVAATPAPVFDVTGFTDRGVTGTTTFTDDDGNTQTVTLQ